MKIENTSHITQALGQAGATGRQAKAPPPPEHSVAKSRLRTPVKLPAAANLGAHGAGVCVTLSPTARSMGVGRANGDFDADKVKVVREAIQKGSFTVNTAAVADRLLASPVFTDGLPALRKPQ